MHNGIVWLTCCKLNRVWQDSVEQPRRCIMLPQTVPQHHDDWPPLLECGRQLFVGSCRGFPSCLC